MASSAPQEQSGLEDVRSTLIEIAQEGSTARPDGVALTYIGSEFVKRKNAPFEQYMNFLAVQNGLNIPSSARKMIPFIRTYCSDIFVIEHTATGTDLLKLKGEIAPAVDEKVVSAPNFKYKKAVWAAFIRPLPDGFKRYLDMDTLGFTDGKRKPPGGVWLEIKREFITETPMSEPIDGPLVQAKIGAWVSDNNVNVEVLLDRSPAGQFERPSLADLMRIIDSLPDHVTRGWTIPAEVLRHLKGSE